MNSVFQKPEWRHPIRTVKQFFISLKWVWQRATRGYCHGDLYGVGAWFLAIVPDMIEDIKNRRIGYPALVEDDHIEDGEWDEILSRLIFLLREANYLKENVYQEEFRRIHREFEEKFGKFDEYIMTDEMMAQESDCSVAYFNCQDVRRRYLDEEQRICEYRDRCEAEALEMFLKYFACLGC